MCFYVHRNSAPADLLTHATSWYYVHENRPFLYFRVEQNTLATHNKYITTERQESMTVSLEISSTYAKFATTIMPIDNVATADIYSLYTSADEFNAIPENHISKD